MAISTDPVGSLPQMAKLQTVVTDHGCGGIRRQQEMREQDAAATPTRAWKLRARRSCRTKSIAHRASLPTP